MKKLSILQTEIKKPLFESGANAAKSLQKEVAAPKDLSMAMYKYFITLTEEFDKEKVVGFIVEALEGIGAGLQPSKNSDYVDLAMELTDAAKKLKKL